MMNKKGKNILDGAVILAISILILLNDEFYISKIFVILAIIIIVYINERRKSKIKDMILI